MFQIITAASIVCVLVLAQPLRAANNIADSPCMAVYDYGDRPPSGPDRVKALTECINSQGASAHERAMALIGRAIAYDDMSEMDLAYSDLKTLSSMPIGEDINLDARGYNALGVVYGCNYEDKKAIEYFTKAIQLKNDYAEAYFNRGIIYSLSDDKNAIRDMAMAKRHDPVGSKRVFDRMETALSRSQVVTPYVRFRMVTAWRHYY